MKIHLCAVLAILGVSFVQAQNNGCPKHPGFRTEITYGGKCYGFSKGTVTYNNAAQSCRHIGGLLALPKTRSINSFLASKLSSGTKNRAWIGLNDKKEERVFRWEDGSRLNFQNGFHKFDDKAEGPHKPYRPLRFVEDCVALDRAGTWHDYICTTAKYYAICEFDIPKTTTTMRTTRRTPRPTRRPTTRRPTTRKPTTRRPRTPKPTTMKATTMKATTMKATTMKATTMQPTTMKATTMKPTTQASLSSSSSPSTMKPTTEVPTTERPTTIATTSTMEPSTVETTMAPPSTTQQPTSAPVTTTPTAATTTTTAATTFPTAASTSCPILDCDIDCGLLGQKVDSNGCFICECDE